MAVLTKTQRKMVGKGKLGDDVPISKAQRESSKRALSTGDLALGLIPLSVGVAGARLLATEGAKAVTKRYGSGVAKTIIKYKDKFKSVLNPASNMSKKLKSTGRFMDPKSGRFITKSQAKLLKMEGTARKGVGAATLAGLVGVAASGGGDSRKRNEEIGEPGTVTDTGDSRKRNEEIGEPGTVTDTGRTPKPKLVDRKGKSPYSDDSTQDDYALRTKVSTRDKAEEENISEAAAEQNLKRGGPVKKKKATAAKSKYGMKKGGFTSKGGAYY
tara:strand:+ start:419 stop:1231 length:813 start_codon:yes stop_codon:yes gene_type:complete